MPATEKEVEDYEKGDIEGKLVRMRSALGPDVMEAFEDDDIPELYANPHERNLRFDTHSEGKVVSDIPLRKGKIEQFLNVVASWASVQPFGEKAPSLSTELPSRVFHRSRLQGAVPPIVAAPSLVIRKPATKMYSLPSYVENDIMTKEQHETIKRAVDRHFNILVVGGTGSGKTTLVNAVIEEITRQFPDERLVILEDTREIQCAASDRMQLTTAGRAGVGLVDLVKQTLRLSPDRVLVGECRDETALYMCDVWSTGHPGGACTLHATTPHGALERLDNLAQRASKKSQAKLIGEAVDIIVHITGGNEGRNVESVTAVRGHSEGEYTLLEVA